MALPLHIPTCILPTPHPHHPPPLEKPLRIQIEGPLVSVQKLLPDVPWQIDDRDPDRRLQPAAQELAKLAYEAIYGCHPRAENDLIVRDEYLGWIYHKNEIDYYGVTFDHFVAPDEHFPKVLQINIVEIESDDAEYANTYNSFMVDPADYIGKKILAVPRCCQKRKGTTDRSRVNGSVTHRDLVRQGFDQEAMMNLLIAYGVYSTEPPKIRFDIVPQPPSTTLKQP
ncbi:hypothetical protein V8C35DRAFT_327498 [Trichoderma chlorosporum]